MKKGTIGVKEIIGWGIGLLVLFTVLFVILGPDMLLPQAAKAAFAFGLGKLPEDRAPPPGSGGAAPADITADFENFVATLNANERYSHCIVPLSKIPDMKDNYFIELYPNGAALRKPGDGTGTYGSKSINGEPCVVAWNGAENFYNNWLDTTIEPTPTTPEYFNNAGANNLKIESQTKITLPKITETNKKEYDISNDDGQRFLYKADANHFCFISVKGGGDCKLRDDNKAIEKGCFDKITDVIKICGGEDKPTFMRNLIANGYRKDIRDAVVGFNNAITQAVKSTKDICKVEFTKYPGFDNDGIVSMFKSGTSLDVEVTPNKALIPPGQIVLLQKVDNYQPCIVHGQNFWKWLWKENGEAKTSQYIDKTYVKIVGDGKNGVRFLPNRNEEYTEEKRDLYGERPLIYKTVDKSGNKHICIIQRWDKGTCEEDTTERNAVAQRCIEKNNPDYLESLGRTPTC